MIDRSFYRHFEGLGRLGNAARTSNQQDRRRGQLRQSG